MKISSFKIEEWINKYESSAKYDLTTTCISPLSVNELCSLTGIVPDIFDTKLGYGDILGSYRLKTAIKSLYENQELENISITHGAIGANQLVFFSLLEKGDEVVSIVPTYQQHYSIPQSLGADVKLIFLREENNWLPDLEELDRIITSKTKVLCLNNPNNPTGAVIPDWLLYEIVKIAQKNNVWILSDEVYRGLNLYGNPYSKSIADIYEKGISVGSMSKTYSLPGLRLGWVTGRIDLINEINHQRQYNTISVSILDDYFSAIALENKDCIAHRNFEIMKTGLKTLNDWIKNNPNFECVAPTGGSTTFVKYNFDIPSREFCKKIQQKTGVALLPGETLEVEGYFRLGFCADNLEIALNKISECF